MSKGFITQPDSQLQETSKQNQTKISYAFKITLNSYKNRIAWIDITWTRTVYFLYYRLTFKQQLILTELGHTRHGAVISSRNHHTIAMYCIDIILHCSYCPAWFAWDSQFICITQYCSSRSLNQLLSVCRRMVVCLISFFFLNKFWKKLNLRINRLSYHKVRSEH